MLLVVVVICLWMICLMTLLIITRDKSTLTQLTIHDRNLKNKRGVLFNNFHSLSKISDISLHAILKTLLDWLVHMGDL